MCREDAAAGHGTNGIKVSENPDFVEPPTHTQVEQCSPITAAGQTTAREPDRSSVGRYLARVVAWRASDVASVKSFLLLTTIASPPRGGRCPMESLTVNLIN